MPSISLAKGKGSLSHNNREYSTENVDINKTKNNITYKKETLSEAYANCFTDAINNYNKTQKRNDRRINGIAGYMEQIKNSKNGEKLFYENIVQIGNMFDSHIDSSQGEICKKVLDDYMRSFEIRNPNLYVFNAVLHLDEQTPHLHIDYIPIGHNYKNGLKARNSLDRAFKEQGMDGKSNKYENRTIAWQNVEKDYIEKIMLNYNLERTEDKGLKREHLTIEQYKAVVSHIDNQVEKLPTKINKTPALLNKEKVVVKVQDLENLEKRAKLSYIHQDNSKKILSKLEKEKGKKIKDELYDVKDKYNNLVNKYNNLVKKSNDLIKTNKIVSSENEILKSDNNRLLEDVEDVTHRFINTVKAFGMLKYDHDGDYGIDNLSDKQSKLFDAILNYAKSYLDFKGEKEKSKDISEKVGFSKGIENKIKDLMPKIRSRDWER